MINNLKEAKNNGEKEFKVYITETLGKMVKVMAKDEHEAEIKVRDQYNDEEIILYPEDLVDVDFEVVSSNKTEAFSYARPNAAKIYEIIEDGAFDESFILRQLLRNLPDDEIGQALENVIGSYKDLKWIASESLKEDYDSARPNMEMILDALDSDFYSESTVLDALLRGLDDNILGYILEDLIDEYKEALLELTGSLSEGIDLSVEDDGYYGKW